MAQGDRTPAQAVVFRHNLQNVNLLYLGMRVLVLADISYLSRFWCVRRTLRNLPPHRVPQAMASPPSS